MAIYMVDRDLPRITSADLVALQQSAMLASEQLTAIGRPVHYIRSMYILGEARCLCLFEAQDDATVAAVNELAGLPFTRIVTALDLASPNRSWYKQGGVLMNQICLVLPILAGKTAIARDFMRELEDARNAEYDLSDGGSALAKKSGTSQRCRAATISWPTWKAQISARR